VLGPNSNSNPGWQLGNYHERATPQGLPLSPCDGLKAAATMAAANMLGDGEQQQEQPAGEAKAGSKGGGEGGVSADDPQVLCPTPSNCTVGGNATVSTCFDAASQVGGNRLLFFFSLSSHYENTHTHTMTLICQDRLGTDVITKGLK